MSDRSLTVLSRTIAGVTVVALISAIVSTIGNPATRAADVPFVIAFAAGMIGMSAVGAVIATRAPHNSIGWLFQVSAGTLAIAIVAQEYAVRAATQRPELPAGPYVAALNPGLFPYSLAALATILLVFPQGRLLSRRWRVLVWIIWAGAATGSLADVLGVEAFDDLAEGIRIANPLSVGTGSAWRTASAIGFGALLAGSIVALGSVLLRYRRAAGEERQQVRWLAWAAALVLASIVAVVVTGATAGPDGVSAANDVAAAVLIAVLTIGVPVACAVAVLRYRLYDLDLVIKKAAVFTIVAIFLTAVYVVALALAALSFLGSIAAAVLFVLTFNPIRRRARRLADRLVYGVRATPFEVLSEFSERVGETYSIDEVLPRMAQLLAASTGATEARVWLRGERELSPVAAWPSDLEDIGSIEVTGDDLPVLDGLSSFPVTHQGDLLGAITLRLPANDPMDPQKERLVSGLASQAGLALRNVRLVEDLRASRRRIVSAQDERAKRLERDIHDGAQQQLVALAVKLRLADAMVDRDVAAAHELLAQLGTEAGDALENLRDLARGIYPPLLADKGLAAALEGQARKSPVPVTLEADGVGRYPPEIEAAVYFCSLEALNNVAKYANASHTSIRLAHADGRLEFEVRDDGDGFDPGTTGNGSGLQGIADRLAVLGGRMSIRSAPGSGTVVRGTVPTKVG